MIWPGTDALEEASSNAARKGDSDYGHGQPLTQAQKDAIKKRKRGAKGTREGGRFIKQGSSGSEVEDVQKGVGAEVTGTYTANTAASVMAFQRKHGLKVDGVVGRQTLRALSGDVEGARKTTPGAIRGREGNLSRAAATRKRKRKKNEGRGTGARGGFLAEELREAELILQERAIDVQWKESEHPRDTRGRFRKKLGTVTPVGRSGPSAIQLPDGTRISQDRDGTYRVVRSGRIHSGFKTKDAAIQDALDRSARATNSPNAVGGQTRYRDYNEYMSLNPQAEWRETDTLENLRARLERARADALDARTAEEGSYQRRREAATLAAVRHLEHRIRQAERNGGAAPAAVPAAAPTPAAPPASAFPNSSGTMRVSRHYQVGTRVRHNTYGLGTIRAGRSGENYPEFDNGTIGTRSTRVAAIHVDDLPAADGPSEEQIRTYLDGIPVTGHTTIKGVTVRRRGGGGLAYTVQQPGTPEGVPMSRDAAATWLANYRQTPSAEVNGVTVYDARAGDEFRSGGVPENEVRQLSDSQLRTRIEALRAVNSGEAGHDHARIAVNIHNYERELRRRAYPSGPPAAGSRLAAPPDVTAVLRRRREAGVITAPGDGWPDAAGQHGWHIERSGEVFALLARRTNGNPPAERYRVPIGHVSRHGSGWTHSRTVETFGSQEDAARDLMVKTGALPTGDGTSPRSPGRDPVAAAAPSSSAPIVYTPQMLSQLRAAHAQAPPGSPIAAAVQTQIDAAEAQLGSGVGAPAPPREFTIPRMNIAGYDLTNIDLRAVGSPASWDGGIPRLYVSDTYLTAYANRTGRTQGGQRLTFERVDQGRPPANALIVNGVPYVVRQQSVHLNRQATLTAIQRVDWARQNPERARQRGETGGISRARYGSEAPRRHVEGSEQMHPATARHFEQIEAARQERVAASRGATIASPRSPATPAVQAQRQPAPGYDTLPTTGMSRAIADRLLRDTAGFERATNTQIEAVGYRESAGTGFLYVRGRDGRSWSMNVDRVAQGEFSNESIQVRTQGGESHGAPAFASFAHGAVGGRPSTAQGPLGSVVRHPEAPEGPARHGASRSGPSPVIDSPAVATAPGSAPRVRGSGPKGPQIQAIVDRLHGFSHGGYTCKITGASSNGFSGSVIDANGRPVGNFSRELYDDDTIYHAIFQIQQSARASGFGTRLVNEMFESYREQGFKKVRVSAGLDVGGYQWAKQGFEHTGGPRAVAQHARSYIGKVRHAVSAGHIPQALADEFERQVEEGMITSMGQIAAWGRRTTWEVTMEGVTHKMWLGKVLLLGSAWSGVKKLT